MRRRTTLPGSLSIALACAWLLGGGAPSALAQASVQYEAAPACPGREAFLERVRARVRVDGTRLPADLVLRVTLAVQGAGTHGTVELRRGATKTQRSVDAARCEEVVEALALITALALNEDDTRNSRRERPRKADKRGPSPPPPPATSSPPAALAPAAESGAAPATPELTATTPDPAIPAPAVATSAASTPPPPPPPPLPAAEDAAPWAFSTSTGASFITFTGLAPALQPGLQLQAAFSLSSEAGALSLQLGARMARQDRLVSPDGAAWFGFMGGVLRACGSRALGSTLALSGCAVAEPGVFSTGAENTDNPRSHTRAWLALGAAAQLSLRLASWLRLQAGVELLAPLRRDRMSLAGDTLYRVPRLGSRLHIGLEIPFG